MDRLESGAPVFKLVGAVLLNQELDEAKQNVDKRIEFIMGEMYVQPSICAYKI